MKNFLLFIAMAGLISCNSQTKKANANLDSLSTDTMATDTGTHPDADTAKSIASSSSKWVYSEQEDKMTSKKKYFATIEANELLQFDFPYDGGVTAGLTIRHQNGENDALLQITKGQFITGVDGTTVKIRVDNAPAVTYSASGPSDGSTEVLFINNANKLIRKMKAAKKVLIQAEFYDSGYKVMEFDVTGFKWEH